jgi:hypothetical protein
MEQRKIQDTTRRLRALVDKFSRNEVSQVIEGHLSSLANDILLLCVFVCQTDGNCQKYAGILLWVVP